MPIGQKAAAAMNISTKIHESGTKQIRKAKSFFIQTIRGFPATDAGYAGVATSTSTVPQFSSAVAEHDEQQGMGESSAKTIPASGARSRGLFAGRTLRRTASFWLPGKRGALIECSAGQRPTLGALFFALPLELQLETVQFLSFRDIMALHRTCRAFRNLIADHETHIVKQHIKGWIPKYISILYPSPTDTAPNLQFIEGLHYRQRISTQLAVYLAQQIVKEMGQTRRMRKRPLGDEVVGYIIEQLTHGMAPLILALFHFLETYRTKKVEDLHLDLPKSSQEQRDLHLQSDIILRYPDCLLLQIHQMYHLLLHLFVRRLTPMPIWLSRTPLGRWNHVPLGPRPSDETFAKVLLLGGIPEVWRLYKTKGSGRRKKVLDKYTKKIDSERKANISPRTDMPGTYTSISSIPIDRLGNIWVPAAEKQLLGRGLVASLDEVTCCGEFVAELLGNDDLSTNSSSDEDGDGSEDEMSIEGQAHITGNPAYGMFTGMHFGTLHLRLADDGNWDNNLIEEQEDDEDDFEVMDVEETHKKPASLPQPNTFNGESSSSSPLSWSPGIALGVGSSAAVGYQGMGGSFLSIVS